MVSTRNVWGNVLSSSRNSLNAKIFPRFKGTMAPLSAGCTCKVMLTLPRVKQVVREIFLVWCEL